MSNLPTGDEYMRSRAETVEEMLGKFRSDDDEVRESAIDEIDEYPLSVTTRRIVTVLLGTGGPHDEVNAVIDEDDYVVECWYEYHWGGDSYRRDLYDGDPLRELAEHYISGYVPRLRD